MVAAAAIGGAIIGGVASNSAAKRSAKAAEGGADSAAAAQLESTRMQVEEIRRQFDYQQQILLPQIQRQYAAQTGYNDLLGIGNAGFSGSGGGSGAGNQSQVRAQQLRQQIQGASDPRQRANLIWELNQLEGPDASLEPDPIGPTPGTTFQRGANGEFVDPNLDPTRLADQSQLFDQVQGSLQAGTSAADDPYRNYIADNRIAAPTLEDDLRYQRATGTTMQGERGGISLADQRGGVSLMNQRGGVRNAGDSLTGDEYYMDVAGRSLAEGAAGTGVYGDSFEASPGYAFAREEMERAGDRIGSRGGNVGGRAIIEAQRRAKGLADQEYYNWAAGRERDLMRRGGAESQDAARVDAAGANYLTRRAMDIGRGDEFARTDIGRGDEFARFDIGRGDAFSQYDMARGDAAVDSYDSQRVSDIARDDAAYQNYLARRQGDAARTDAAVAERDRLRGVDLQRRDQGYYNYLNAISAPAGFGNPAAQAVGASQAAGGAVAGAYANQGNVNSQIYSNLGGTMANIQYQRGANINNAIQSGLQNYMTYQYMQQQPAANDGMMYAGGTPGFYNTGTANDPIYSIY